MITKNHKRKFSDIKHKPQCTDKLCFCVDPEYPDPVCDCGNPGWACSCDDKEEKQEEIVGTFYY